MVKGLKLKNCTEKYQRLFHIISYIKYRKTTNLFKTSIVSVIRSPIFFLVSLQLTGFEYWTRMCCIVLLNQQLTNPLYILLYHFAYLISIVFVLKTVQHTYLLNQLYF